jgi:hypothetical protein
MRACLLHGFGWLTGAFVCALVCAPGPAAAQSQGTAEDAYAYAAPQSVPTGEARPADAPIGAEPSADDESAMLGQMPMFDPATLAATTPSKPLKLPSLYAPQPFDVSRSDQSSGSSTVVVKKPLPAEYGATVGADLNLASTPSTGYRPNPAAPAIADNPGSGAAWASVGVTQYTSVDARLDATNTQSKIGGTLKQSIPLGQKFSVTLQNTYSVTDTFNPATASPSSLSNLPLMTAPAAAAPTTAPMQIWGDEKNVKFNILPTGTTLGAGLTTASNDPITHNMLSADQKLYGPLHVTTAVTDVGQTTVSKSISAGLKFNW